MRDGPVGSIHTDVFSTHPEVMIENSHSENTTIRYAFMPHTDKWEKAKLYDEALAFNAPLKVCQFGKQEGIF